MQDVPEIILELMQMRGQATPVDMLLEITTCVQKRNHDIFLGMRADEQDAFWDGVREVYHWENTRWTPP
jgi:hypothetical protein